MKLKRALPECSIVSQGIFFEKTFWNLKFEQVTRGIFSSLVGCSWDFRKARGQARGIFKNRVGKMWRGQEKSRGMWPRWAHPPPTVG